MDTDPAPPENLPPNRAASTPAETASSPPKRIGQEIGWYFSLLLVILVACLPGLLCSLFYLSTVPDVTWRHGELAYTRVWMVQEKGPIGLALERQRVQNRPAADQACVRTIVRYLFWQQPDEAGRNSRYSRLYSHTDQGWQATGQRCSEE